MPFPTVWVGVAVVAAVLATGWRFANTNFPRTGAFLCRSPDFAFYLAIHAFCASVLTASMVAFVSIGIVRASALTPFVGVALVAAGIGARQIAERASFTVVVGSKKIRCGFKPILDLADSRIREIRWDEFNAVRTFVARYAGGQTLESARAAVLENIAPGLDEKEVDRFRVDVAASGNAATVMEIYLRFAGRRSFKRVFGPELALVGPAAPRTA